MKPENNFNTIGNLSVGLVNASCQNQLAVAGLGSSVASEACATRQVVSDGFRDAQMAAFINSQNQIAAFNAGNQAIMDKICQLELPRTRLFHSFVLSLQLKGLLLHRAHKLLQLLPTTSSKQLLLSSI